MIGDQDVVQCFRAIFGRDPESDSVIEHHKRFGSTAELLVALIATPEYQQKSKSITFKEKWVVCDVVEERYLMWVDLGDRYVSYGCLHDNYEPAETHFIKSIVTSEMTVADIGANIGWFTIILADRVGTNGRVYAFEPRQSTYKYLAKTVAMNGLLPAVHLYNVALGDQTGTALVTWGRESDNRGGAFLSTEFMDVYQQEETPVVRLDDLSIGRLDFIKIDIEGFEPRALIGGVETVRRNMPIILCEINFEQLARVGKMSWAEYGAFLKSLGYDRYVMIDGKGAGSVSDAAAAGIDVINIAIWPGAKNHMLGYDYTLRSSQVW